MKKPFVLISAAATLILLIGAAALLMGYVHTPPQPKAVQTFDAADEVGGFEAALEERTAGEAKYIRKLYSVQAGELPPQPKAACYSATNDPQEVQAVIDAAAVLLDGQETFWNADIDFMPNSEMRYYRDDSILVVAWQEAIEGRGCSFVEVKLADGSQLRRKISGDSYRAAGLKTATELAAEDNAVMAVSGDFYVRRSIGIGVYGGELQYFSPIAVHTCMFTSGGDMLLLRPGDIQTWEDAEKFISDNDVEFSVNFGQILVENGELQDLSSGYVYGEVDSKYSRCAIGQRGELHYLIMTVCYEQNYGTCTASTEARFMHDKGVDTAYALDGGHTATIAMNGSAYNRPDWGWQNAISDVICFASAEYD